MPTPASVNSEEEIRGVLAQWAEVVRRSDAQAVAAMVTEDAEFWTQGAPPLTGRAAVGAAFEALLARFELDQEFELQELILAGDVAFVRGTERNRLTPREGGEALEIRQRAFSVLRKEPDGAWRFARGMTNQGAAE